MDSSKQSKEPITKENWPWHLDELTDREVSDWMDKEGPAMQTSRNKGWTDRELAECIRDF